METYYGVVLMKPDKWAIDFDMKVPCLVFDDQQEQRAFMVESKQEALAFKESMDAKCPYAEYAVATITF